MLQPSYIRENLEAVAQALSKRGLKEVRTLLDNVIMLDDNRKKYQTELGELQAQSNSIAKEIGNLFKQGKQGEAQALKEKAPLLKEKIKELSLLVDNTKNDLANALYDIPNAPHELVPAGISEEDNEVFKGWNAEMPSLPASKLPHWELAEKYKLFDLKLGAKITGAGFPLYRGKGAKLQRALIQFFLDEATKAGYEEIIPPHLVNEDSAFGTGQLPDKEGQMYHATADDLYLIPTAEVPITNIFRDVILEENDFPIKMAGYTPCFRREAGSYGAHVRGLNRVHQFDKVEIVRIEHPDTSYQALDEMLNHVSQLLHKLELPYRILRLCGGDLGFASALTYDFEVFSAAQERWLEVSSVSNFETFQSNRLKLRYRDNDNHKHLAHTLNGSALALARIYAAILENNQVEDGILVPKVLQPYTGFDKIS